MQLSGSATWCPSSSLCYCQSMSVSQSPPCRPDSCPICCYRPALHTLPSPRMPSRRARSEEAGGEEKGAMIDLNRRHLSLSPRLIGPTSIQQCCRLFLCKHKHWAKSVPELFCLPGSLSAPFLSKLEIGSKHSTHA